MAKSPKKAKDPAHPTRSKAAREHMPPMSAELEELLNPALRRGDAGIGSGTGLQPPPSNSKDRRADNAAAHKARASTPQGFSEAPQAGYVGKTPVGETPAGVNTKLAQALGYRIDEDDEAAPLPAGFSATASALDSLLRSGRREFVRDDGTQKIWTPHRPPRPEKSEGGIPFKIVSDFEPKGDQPSAIRDLVEGARRNDRTQVLLGVTGSC
jgi:excinuclease ABC subunit B